MPSFSNINWEWFLLTIIIILFTQLQYLESKTLPSYQNIPCSISNLKAKGRLRKSRKRVLKMSNKKRETHKAILMEEWHLPSLQLDCPHRTSSQTTEAALPVAKVVLTHWVCCARLFLVTIKTKLLTDPLRLYITRVILLPTSSCSRPSKLFKPSYSQITNRWKLKIPLPLMFLSKIHFRAPYLSLPLSHQPDQILSTPSLC